MSWDAERAKSGKRPFNWIALELERCIHTYGDAPCTAALGVTGAHKCVNGWETCQDRDNYSAASYWLRICEAVADVPLQFDFGADPGLDNFVPLLETFSHDPSLPDPGESLGLRVRFTARLRDAPHHDIGIDKYALERLTGEASLLSSGTAQAGGADTLTLAAEEDQAAAGRVLRLVSGAGSVQQREILTYNDATKVATIEGRWATNRVPDSEGQSAASWLPAGILVTTAVYTDGDGAVLDELEEADAVQNDQIERREDGIGDTDTFVYSRKIKKTSADAHYARMALVFALGASQKTAALTFNTNTGAISVSSNVDAVGVEDRGDTWRVWLVATNNGSGNTRLRALFSPAWNTTGLTAGQAATVGSKISGAVQVEKADSLGEYIKTTGAAITAPDATTDYEMREAFAPMERSTLLRKLKARWPHYVGRRLKWYQGYITEAPALADFQVRNYVMERWDGPDARGRSSIVCNDVLRLLEDKRAQAPFKSRGTLMADLDDVTLYTQLDVATVDPTEYDLEVDETSCSVRIGDELFQYTGTAAITDGVRLTGVTREAPAPYTTEKSEHDAGDLVQRCVFLRGTVPAVVEILMTRYGGIDAAFIPTADWSAEAEIWAPESIERLITEPEGVTGLVTEIIEQTITWGFWFDEIDQEIKFRAVRPADVDDTVIAIDDRSGLVAGSVEPVDLPDKLVNELHVLFGQIDPTQGRDELGNYRTGASEVAADSQGPNETSQKRSRVVYARWHPASNAGVVEQFARRTVNARSKNVMEVRFKLERKDEDVRTAQFCDLTTIYIVGALGAPETTRVQVLQVNAKGEEVSFRAREDFFRERFGRLAPVELEGLLWDDATEEQRERYMFLAQADGTFTNGDRGKALV